MASSDNPFTQKNTQNETSMETVANSICEVSYAPPTKAGTTGTYHIKFEKNQTISLTTAQMAGGPKHFKTMFQDVFKKRLFVNKEFKEWDNFVDWIMSNAVEVQPEETAAVMAGKMLFEKIVNEMEITDDRNEISGRRDCNKLVIHKPHDIMWYVLPSSAIYEIIEDLPIAANPADVSQAMTACGFKQKNNMDVKVKNKPITCWWFVAAKVNEHSPFVEGVEVGR